MKHSMTCISDRVKQLINSGEAANYRDACRILQQRSAKRRSANAARKRIRPHWQDN